MTTRVAAAFGTVLILTACASTPTAPTSSDAPKATSPTTTRTTTATPPTTEPQILVKKLGEPAAFGSPTCLQYHKCDIEFTLTKLSDCTGGYPGDAPPAGTKRKLVWMKIQTGAAYSSDVYPSSFFTTFRAISADGVTSGEINPSTFWDCAPSGSRLGFGDENWRPGKKYAGAVEIYLPDGSARITNGEGGWEWVIR